MKQSDQDFILNVIKQVEKEMIANGCMTTATYLQLLECERMLATKAGRKPKAKEEQ